VIFMRRSASRFVVVPAAQAVTVCSESAERVALVLYPGTATAKAAPDPLVPTTSAGFNLLGGMGPALFERKTSGNLPSKLWRVFSATTQTLLVTEVFEE
jgi:hypothetical protein